MAPWPCPSLVVFPLLFAFVWYWGCSHRGFAFKVAKLDGTETAIQPKVDQAAVASSSAANCNEQHFALSDA